MMGTYVRVCVTTPALDGGIGRNLVNLARVWVDKGVEVDLILDRECPTQTNGLPKEVTVYVSGGSHPIAKVPWLVWYLRKRRPIGMLTPVPRHTVWALRAKCLSRAPVNIVANVHNDYQQTTKNLTEEKKRSRIALLGRYYPQCEAIVPVSQGAAQAFSLISGVNQSALTVIPNPVVTETMRLQAGEAVDHAWFLDKTIPIVIWVGRIEYAKNVDLLVDAFEILRRKMSCRLVIVGTGSKERELCSRIESSFCRESIALLGFQSNPYRYISNASVLAMSSRWEGFGNVLVEAMALGVPVASVAYSGGAAEILENGKFGPLTPLDDAQALADGLAQCLMKPLPSSVLIDAAQKYRSDVIAQRYLDLLTKSLKAGK